MTAIAALRQTNENILMNTNLESR